MANVSNKRPAFITTVRSSKSKNSFVESLSNATKFSFHLPSLRNSNAEAPKNRTKRRPSGPDLTLPRITANGGPGRSKPKTKANGTVVKHNNSNSSNGFVKFIRRETTNKGSRPTAAKSSKKSGNSSFSNVLLRRRRSSRDQETTTEADSDTDDDIDDNTLGKIKEEEPSSGGGGLAPKLGAILRLKKFVSESRMRAIERLRQRNHANNKSEILQGIVPPKITLNSSSKSSIMVGSNSKDNNKENNIAGKNLGGGKQNDLDPATRISSKSEIIVHSTISPLPSEMPPKKKPLKRALTSNALGTGPNTIHPHVNFNNNNMATGSPKNPAAGSRKNSGKSSGSGGKSPSFLSSILAKREQANLQRHASWGFLRNRLVNAKISDAFSNIRFTVNGEPFKALRCIGEGGYAKVYEVFDDRNELYALKVVDLDETKVKEELLSEIKFLEKFNDCEKVINMFGFEHKSNVYGLASNGEEKEEGDDMNRVLEKKRPETASSRESKSWLFVLMERGEIDLDRIVQGLQLKKRFTSSKIRFYWEQMLEAVAEVHDRGVIHADLKPANFMLVGGTLKLIDFGLACQIDLGEEFASRNFVAGTKDYLSPESFSAYVIEDGALNVDAMKEMRDNGETLEIQISVKADVWALGIILYQWAYDSTHPYSTLPGGKFTRIKALTSLDVPINLDPLGDPMLRDTIRLCLEKRVENRPTVRQLLAHPYLQSP